MTLLPRSVPAAPGRTSDKGMTRIFSAIIAGCLLISMVSASPVHAADPDSTAAATCSRPASDADALYILANIAPAGDGPAQAYWWSKTDLTIGVSAPSTVDPAQFAAVEQAIVTWQQTLEACLAGAVTLTYIPIAPGDRAQTDIVVHLVPHAGGSAFGGRAECGPSGCNNVIVSYIGPPGRYEATPVPVTSSMALHEIGHALGLGHATNLYVSTDLMGYGWINAESGRVAISQCDVDALAYIWAWALDGADPTEPDTTLYQCD